MATTTAISSKTAADTADVSVGSGESIQVWTVPMLPADESVRILRIDSGDTVEVPVFDNGELLALSKENPQLLLNGPAVFRLDKSVTATATAVYYDS